jgi:hypothetical protein
LSLLRAADAGENDSENDHHARAQT